MGVTTVLFVEQSLMYLMVIYKEYCFFRDDFAYMSVEALRQLDPATSLKDISGRAIQPHG